MSLNLPHLPSPAPTPEHPALPPQLNGFSSIEEEKKKTREELENRLKNLQQDLYELEICAGAVVAGQEERIPMYMKRINEQFIALNDLSQRMQPELQTQPGLLNGHADGPQVTHANGTMIFGDSVPKSVIEHVDTYRNPHGYTKNALSRATGENQYALGRMLGLESFRRQLHDAIGKELPDVPLPPRRHQPVYDKDTTVEDGQKHENGLSSALAEQQAAGTRLIKQEDMAQYTTSNGSL